MMVLCFIQRRKKFDGTNGIMCHKFQSCHGEAKKPMVLGPTLPRRFLCIHIYKWQRSPFAGGLSPSFRRGPTKGGRSFFPTIVHGVSNLILDAFLDLWPHGQSSDPVGKVLKSRRPSPDHPNKWHDHVVIEGLDVGGGHRVYGALADGLRSQNVVQGVLIFLVPFEVVSRGLCDPVLEALQGLWGLFHVDKPAQKVVAARAPRVKEHPYVLWRFVGKEVVQASHLTTTQNERSEESTVCDL